jgi:hypothetical protein
MLPESETRDRDARRAIAWMRQRSPTHAAQIEEQLRIGDFYTAASQTPLGALRNPRRTPFRFGNAFPRRLQHVP